MQQIERYRTYQTDDETNPRIEIDIADEHGVKEIVVPFDDIPSGSDPGEWLTDKLNEELSFETTDANDELITTQRYTANAKTIQTDPIKVAVSLESQ